MMLGLSVGLTASAKVASESPPTVLTFTVPSTSDETVQVTELTCSEDTTHAAVTENATPPAYPGAEWFEYNPASPPEVTTASAGAVTFYAWAYSPEGGVGATAESGSTTVVPNPWLTAGMIYYCQCDPAWGGVVTVDTGVVSQVNDIIPESAYPTGKTGPFHYTSAGGSRPDLGSDGKSVHISAPALRTMNCAEPELLAFINGVRTQQTHLIVTNIDILPPNTAYWHGLNGSGGTTAFRMSEHNVSGMRVLVQASSGVAIQEDFPDTDPHVWMLVLDGTTATLSNELGVCGTANYTSQTDAMAIADWILRVTGGGHWEWSGWGRDLTGPEQLTEIGRAAARHGIPL